MKAEIKTEIERLIKKLNLNCTANEFKDNVGWFAISCYQKMSENFIREFKDNVDWNGISCCQKMSEDFMREFSDRVDWRAISFCQNLFENFIREFRNNISKLAAQKKQRESK